ncbi:MAG: tRNA (adenosine(37)-N6)-dimethylallyltransferase MiaA [Bryobacterales bacterium]|nr:tRNA (adenosine(37)-N6)-dimethylallyltransferase MiaA [Bryobacterales bacterium]
MEATLRIASPIPSGPLRLQHAATFAPHNGNVLSPLIAITGPTGSGKSAIALQICTSFGGEVVNCDSLQIYRHFDVGTAKLPLDAREGIPHHLIDILDPDQLFTAGEYSRSARTVVTEIRDRGRVPVVAGGTGFYLRALLDGLFSGPAGDGSLRERLALRHKRRAGSLHRLLARFDPETAARVHPNDLRKLTRALEIRLLTRQPASQVFAERSRQPLQGFRVLKIGLNPEREALYARLNRRTAAMFEGGLIEEVHAILSSGYSASAKPFESHGYKQAIQLLNGELNFMEAVANARQNTRNYAKRQMTWFKRDADIEWFAGFGDEPGIQVAVAGRVRNFLAAASTPSPAITSPTTPGSGTEESI